MIERFNIGKVNINAANIEEAVSCIMENADTDTSCYVCLTNVYACHIGNRDENYGRILNNSFLTFPDGKPLEWYARLSGYNKVRRTCGPDLFVRICELTENTHYTHFFYGSSPEIIAKMKENLLRKWPNLKIVEALSPPFLPARELAGDSIANKINEINPTFVWIGLGAPKQELVMDLLVKKIKSSILIGIGLVFEYQAGTIKRAPLWMQKSGFEWLFRVSQQPKRMIIAIPPFSWITIKIIIKLLKKWE
ncbi:MAG: putative N-acetylmannosaminyltransferase [Candidatus Ordinivivax streblomastigis]|uniref:Putative N-acetylmannosaminyltransferase n=1 Tax=Candidatus Ordinivivax streblomastigis TaxID=2540710 RepID=A0A5M8P6A0_9BACT|nr:MAG: putative N-acetylmannosaminyltransferase [Candidatus Ordinivivax streblomastigis]